MVVTEGDPANPTTFFTKQQRELAITSSYDEEKATMRMAFEWLFPSNVAAVICTDSKSRLERSRAAPQTLLSKQAGKSTLLWIPGHHGIAGNEEADACAGALRQVSFAAASALIC